MSDMIRSDGGFSQVDTRRALANAVAAEVARGGRVESQSDGQAIVRFGKPTNHVLHIIVSVFTLGVWLMVWPCVALYNALTNKTVFITVDEYGNVLRNQL